MTDRIDDASYAKWDGSLSTGIASLDEQHQRLFHCFDVLAQAASERNMLRTFYVLEQLSHYVQSHFEAEERLMRTKGFPGLADHIAEHRAFSNRVHELRRIYLDRDISTDLVEMLRDWLKNHVGHTDMAYVPFVSASYADVHRDATLARMAPSRQSTVCPI